MSNLRLVGDQESPLFELNFCWSWSDIPAGHLEPRIFDVCFINLFNSEAWDHVVLDEGCRSLICSEDDSAISQWKWRGYFPKISTIDVSL